MFIGTSKDIYKTAYLPEQVRNDIESVISTLDKEYGRERDVYNSNGGKVIWHRQRGFLTGHLIQERRR